MCRLLLTLHSRLFHPLLPFLLRRHGLLVLVELIVILRLSQQAGVAVVVLRQSGAYSTAHGAGGSAGKAAFQRGDQGIRGEQALRRFLVTQRRVDGLVGIAFHKGLHGIVDSAGERCRHCRVGLCKGCIPHKALDLGRDLPGQRVLGVVRAHGLGKVGRAHRVDAPARAEFQCAARQRLARALALLDALAYGVARAL